MQALDVAMDVVLAEKIAAIAQEHSAALGAEKEQLLDLLRDRNTEVERLQNLVEDVHYDLQRIEQNSEYLRVRLGQSDVALEKERDDLRDFLGSLEAVSHSIDFGGHPFGRAESRLEMSLRTDDLPKMERWMKKIREAGRT